MKIFLQINQIYHILLLMKAIIIIIYMYFDLFNIHLLTWAYILMAFKRHLSVTCYRINFILISIHYYENRLRNLHPSKSCQNQENHSIGNRQHTSREKWTLTKYALWTYFNEHVSLEGVYFLKMPRDAISFSLKIHGLPICTKQF